MKKVILLALTISMAILLISCGKKIELVSEDYSADDMYNITFDRPADWELDEEGSSLLYYNNGDNLRLEAFSNYYDTNLTTDDAFDTYMSDFGSNGYKVTASSTVKMDNGKTYYCTEMTHIASGWQYYDVVTYEGDSEFVYSFGAADEKTFKANFSKFLPILKTFNVVSVEA